MIIVGITGRSGSGKSTVSNYYRSLGYTVADGDLIAREITAKDSPCLQHLVFAFGADILNNQGDLNRERLAHKAYKNQHTNQQLIDITHPFITQEFLRLASLAKQSGESIFFVDGAMIIGYEFEAYCDEIILVTSPFDSAIQRIIQRDGITYEHAKNRLSAQKSEEFLKNRASYILENSGTHLELEHKAQKILDQLEQKLQYVE